MLRSAALAPRALATLLLVAAPAWVCAATAPYVATGSCRDGRPHGAYELRMPDGKLRVAGAFNQGKRIGTFLFWSSSGQRIALLPFNEDLLSGTVALWYAQPAITGEPRPKLEAVYVGGELVSATSWYDDGRQRAEFRYDHGVLSGVRAWSASGARLADARARALATRDKTADDQFYNTLEAIIRDNPPPCEAPGRTP
jgi:hypothetical protein